MAAFFGVRAVDELIPEIPSRKAHHCSRTVDYPHCVDETSRLDDFVGPGRLSTSLTVPADQRADFERRVAIANIETRTPHSVRREDEFELTKLLGRSHADCADQ